jgi:23S rRNA pseudouridine955/2504/2580 synthase
MLVAKTTEAAAFFSRLFAEGRAGSGIIKRYLAICAGRPAADSGVIRLDLAIRGSPKQSETFYTVQETGALEGLCVSLLELELGTGRTHQIRRHLAMTGNPVLGDDKYGDFALNKKLRKTVKLKQLLLHASRLVIPPQPSGFQLDLTAPLPEYFSVLVSALR